MTSYPYPKCKYCKEEMEGTSIKAYSWIGTRLTKIFRCRPCNREVEITKPETENWSIV